MNCLITRNIATCLITGVFLIINFSCEKEDPIENYRVRFSGTYHFSIGDLPWVPVDGEVPINIRYYDAQIEVVYANRDDVIEIPIPGSWSSRVFAFVNEQGVITGSAADPEGSIRFEGGFSPDGESLDLTLKDNHYARRYQLHGDRIHY